MEGMLSYTQAAVERAMKVQEVILRALAKKIMWWQAAEIIGISRVPTLRFLKGGIPRPHPPDGFPALFFITNFPYARHRLPHSQM